MNKKGNIKKFFHYAYPSQALLVTCKDENKTNPIAIGWHLPISINPPLYGISVSPSRYSYDMIVKSKEFVINFLSSEYSEEINYCGTHSGRSFNKIKETGLNLVDSEFIETKGIGQAFARFECELFDSKKLGDHVILVGKIVSIQIDESAYENDLLNNHKIKPCYYLGDNIYTTISDSRKEF